MAITKETIRSWIDPTKAGIIVVGTPRCGSHFLTDIIHHSISDMVDSVLVDELQLSSSDKFTTAWFTSKACVPYKFTVSSVVIDDAKLSLFNVPANYELIKRQFTTVRLTRNLVDQYMSDLVKQQMYRVHGNKFFHSGMTRDQFAQLITYPVEPMDQLYHFLKVQQVLTALPCDYQTTYADILPLDSSPGWHIKNDYGITPREFFKDFDKMKAIFDSVVFH